MLFFELFPAFMALVAFAAGVWLFVMDRQAAHESAETEMPAAAEDASATTADTPPQRD